MTIPNYLFQQKVMIERMIGYSWRFKVCVHYFPQQLEHPEHLESSLYSWCPSPSSFHTHVVSLSPRSLPLTRRSWCSEPHYSYRLMYQIFCRIWIHQKHLITSNKSNVFNKLLFPPEQHFIFQSGGGNFFFFSKNHLDIYSIIHEPYRIIHNWSNHSFTIVH